MLAASCRSCPLSLYIYIYIYIYILSGRATAVYTAHLLSGRATAAYCMLALRALFLSRLRCGQHRSRPRGCGRPQLKRKKRAGASGALRRLLAAPPAAQEAAMKEHHLRQASAPQAGGPPRPFAGGSRGSYSSDRTWPRSIPGARRPCCPTAAGLRSCPASRPGPSRCVGRFRAVV